MFEIWVRMIWSRIGNLIRSMGEDSEGLYIYWDKSICILKSVYILQKEKRRRTLYTWGYLSKRSLSRVSWKWEISKKNLRKRKWKNVQKKKLIGKSCLKNMFRQKTFTITIWYCYDVDDEVYQLTFISTNRQTNWSCSSGSFTRRIKAELLSNEQKNLSLPTKQYHVSWWDCVLK